MTPPLAVAVVVRHFDGRYLMVRRGADRPVPDVWTTVTGKIEPDETLADACAREVAEETGLAVEVGAEIYRCPTSDGAFTLVWFSAWLVTSADTIHPDLSEIGDARWMSLQDILALTELLPATRAFFERQAQKKSSLD